MRKRSRTLEWSPLDQAYLIGITIGLSLGAVATIIGFILTILGLTGTINWIFEGGAFTSRLGNASPGAIFVVIGLIILLRYKYRYNILLGYKHTYKEYKEAQLLAQPIRDHYEITRSGGTIEGMSR